MDVIRPNVDMMEALRLTRQSRLKEAMAVLHGASAGDAAAGAAKEKEQAATATVLDMVPPSRETGNAWTMPRDSTASITGGWAERLRALNDEFGGLADGPM